MSGVEKKFCEHCSHVSIYPDYRLCEKCARNAEMCAKCCRPDKDTGKGLDDLICKNCM